MNEAEGPFEGLRKFGITSAEVLLAHVVAAEDVLREMTVGIEKNSLEKPIVEYYNFSEYAVPEVDRSFKNLEFLLSMRGTGSSWDRIQSLPGKVSTAYEAEGAYLQGRKRVLSGRTRVLTDSHFKHAMALEPENEDIRYHIFGHILQTARDRMRAKKFYEAEPYIRRAVELWPDSVEARYRYGYILMMQNKTGEAMRQFEALVALEPKRVVHRHQLSSFYISIMMMDRAISHLRVILEIDPEDLKALYNLGNILADRNSFEEAREILQRAYKVAPSDPGVIDSYAWVTYKSGDLQGARAIVRDGGRYYKGNPQFEKRRKTLLADSSAD